MTVSIRLLAWMLLLPLVGFSDDPSPESLKQWVQELGANDFQTREAAEAALIRAGSASASLLKPLVHSNDPELHLRASRILQNLPPDLEGFFADKGTTKGEAREGNTIWPCVFIVTEFDPETGAFSGTIEWTSLNALHKIEGTLTDEALSFSETEFIRRGNAIKDVDYHFPRDAVGGGILKGTWRNPASGRNGEAELSFAEF